MVNMKVDIDKLKNYEVLRNGDGTAIAFNGNDGHPLLNGLYKTVIPVSKHFHENTFVRYYKNGRRYGVMVCFINCTVQGKWKKQ